MDSLGEVIATATHVAVSAAKATSEAVQAAAENIKGSRRAVGSTVGPAAMQFLEQGTETVGRVVTPIAQLPLIKFASKVPGISLLLAALGQVNIEKAQTEVERLRQEYPLETSEQLAHRIMVDTALKAGGIGVMTNFIPPLALTLVGVELAAVTALQAEMVYRIAAAYGFSLEDPTRRGEVLAIFGLSVGGSGMLKVGLSIVELIPLVGTVVGASSDAALIYSLGFLASRFYEAKRNSVAQADITGLSN